MKPLTSFTRISVKISLFAWMITLMASAMAYEIEPGYQGTVRQWSETKTAYNTVLVDASGRVLLLSFDEGEYAGILSVETTAMNNIFVLPQMIQSKNKIEIIKLIKSNVKFNKMLEYYREYLKTGSQVKMDFYLKLRDSLVLDLIERHKANKLF